MNSNLKIRASGVRKAFPLGRRRVPVLDGVDFHASEGEFVAIVGPSGCGKSTFLNILAGLEEPDAGEIELDGVSAQRRLGMVGYMQQKDLLLPWRTVLDNAILALEVRGVPRAQARQRALELTETFGLKGFERQYPASLSGGMRQRAAFLRTVLAEREAVLLDEPFGALDALTRAQMQEWLLERWRSLGVTIVLVTHDVEEALLLSDRVYLFTARPGRVKLVQEVALPRPRSRGLVTTEAFVKLKASLLDSLLEESARMASDTLVWEGAR
ncbi:MAG: ABC transporter ATP-binding protein [Chloroflexota bacterium]|nr:ABC transporter ATP-binding protein [Chloroflexota bacterium]